MFYILLHFYALGISDSNKWDTLEGRKYRMDPATSMIIKKVKKLNRRGKLIDSTSKGLNEKRELVAALMVKTSKPEDAVLKAYDEFYLKHEDGFISKEEYTNSTKVSAAFLQFVI